MLDYITLKDAINEGIVKDGDKITFNPKHRITTLSARDTGWMVDQKIETEDISWVLVHVWGMPMLISTGATKRNIQLQGETGCKNAPNALNKCCEELYSSLEAGMKAQNMTAEIFDAIPDLFKEAFCKERAWLSSMESFNDEGYACMGMERVNNGKRYNICLYHANERAYTSFAGLFPVIYLAYYTKINPVTKEIII